MGRSNFRALLLSGAAAVVVASAPPAAAQDREPVTFDIAAQPLGSALRQFAAQSRVEILFSSKLADNRTAPAVRGVMDPAEGLAKSYS